MCVTVAVCVAALREKEIMMLPSDKTVHGVISREDAARAIYVDFEGFKDKSPCLIGILVEGVLEQVVLDSGKVFRRSDNDDRNARIPKD